MYLSPMPTLIGIVKKKSVEKYSPVHGLATLINYLVRLLYGLPMVHPDSTMIITLSGIGILAATIYLTIFLVFCEHQKQRLVILAVLAVEAVFVAVLAVLVLTLQHTTDQRTLSVGIVCCVVNSMMYIAPLSVMKMVIKTKSLEFMPFWLSVTSFLNACVWTIYGFVPYDPYMAIPNEIGCVFGLGQLILYVTYYKSTKMIMAERKKLPGSIGKLDLSNAISQTQTMS
ncbi:hypothetical protein EUTSA_v10026847mg [Eutrema salsugineum]|uniref:Bidirectional sugar transporter SWEET n=2 Tax=Eutrema salsugineum TaxID=72664 RepID=V4LY73_EUTSA|nr:hypothetical protein EUTSA_v10026847mg [Eutrema salsugineum]